MSPPCFDGSSAAASIVLSAESRSHPILFVEGVCESKLLSHHFPNFELQFIPCGGHSGVFDALETIEKWETKNGVALRILGFVDRDYGIEGARIRVVFTNFRDVEIDLYETEAAVRLVREKGSQEKCSDARAVIKFAKDELRLVGLVRHYNSLFRKQWTINSISIERCVNADSKFNTDYFISQLQQINRLSSHDIANVLKFVQDAVDVEVESVVRGHDLSEYVGKLLRQKFGNRSSSETTWIVIEENLRLASNGEELRRYDWFERIAEHLSESDISAQ